MSNNLGNLGLPYPQAPIGNVPGKDGGTVPVALAHVWYRFLTRLSQLSAEKPIVAVAVGPSPFSWQADTIGHLNVSGGNVTARNLNRGSVTVDVGAVQLIPVAAGDVVTLIYTVAPTLSFIPGARA
jgi:hypothetical protein